MVDLLILNADPGWRPNLTTRREGLTRVRLSLQAIGCIERGVEMASDEGRAPIVYVIDDDAAMRQSLDFLFRSVGLRVAVFASGTDFLRCRSPEGPSCLVLDVGLPGPSGLDLQVDLAKANIHMPIVFMTGHDIPMKSMNAGAVEFLTKPFRGEDMLDAVQRALERSRAARESDVT